MSDCTHLHETIIKDVLDIWDDIKSMDFENLPKQKERGSFSSIAKGTQNLVLTFPVACSTNMSIQSAAMVSKAIERKCVTMVQMLLASFQVTDTDNIQDFLAQFHTNLTTRDFSIDDIVEAANMFAELPGVEVNREQFNAVMADMKNLDYLVKGPIQARPLSEYSIMEYGREIMVMKEYAKETLVDKVKGVFSKGEKKPDPEAAKEFEDMCFEAVKTCQENVRKSKECKDILSKKIFNLLPVKKAHLEYLDEGRHKGYYCVYDVLAENGGDSDKYPGEPMGGDEILDHYQAIQDAMGGKHGGKKPAIGPTDEDVDTSKPGADIAVHTWWFKYDGKMVTEQVSFSGSPSRAIVEADMVSVPVDKFVNMKNKADAYDASKGAIGDANKKVANMQAKFANMTAMDGKDQSAYMKNSAEYFNKMVIGNELKKANELAPSLLAVNFVYKNSNGDPVVIKDVIIGVKTKLTIIDSYDMMDHLASKTQDANWVTQLLRSTTREISFIKDFLLMLDRAKIDALSYSRRGSANKMWKVLERRALKSRMKRAFGRNNNAAAITTMVLSQEEVDFMKKNFHVDLANPSQANKILDGYNLMGFVIVDETMETAKFLFDTGDDIWETLSFGSLEREAGDNTYKKVINMMTKVVR